MNFNRTIEKLNEEEEKTPTVSQLIDFLKRFPSDRRVYITYEPDWKQRCFIKEITYIVDMDTNLSHPLLTVGKISIKFD